MKKRALSLVLAVIMLLGCMSVTAFAEVTNTFSYDADTNTVTINCVLPEVEVGGSVPNESIGFTGNSIDVPSVYVEWAKVTPEGDTEFGSKKWAGFYNKEANFEAGAEYGYLISINFPGATVPPTVIVTGSNGVSVEYEAIPDGILFRFVADFGILGTDSKFYGGDFVVTSGSTSITATVEAAAVDEPVVVPVGYTISIPAAVTMTEAGVQEIGTPTVTNVANATVATVISYTATGTQLTLESDSTKTMTTSYYTNEAGTATMPTTAINVYKDSAFVNPLTTLYVGVTESDWEDAAKNNPGTYTATMTFNFTAVETPCEVELNGPVYRIGDIGTTTAQVGIYFYKNGEFVNEKSSISSASTVGENAEIRLMVGDIPYETGDIFHYDGNLGYVKCTNVKSHTLPNMNTLTQRDLNTAFGLASF